MNIIYIFISKKIFNDKDLKGGGLMKYTQIPFSKRNRIFLKSFVEGLILSRSPLLIRVMLGPSAVVVYNTMRVLMNTSAQVFNIVSSSIYPDFPSCCW